METNKSLSHETAKIPQLSIEANTKLVNLLKTLFGDNMAIDEDLIESYWMASIAAMSSVDLAPFQRETIIYETKQSIEIIRVLYALFQDMKLK